MEEDWDGRRGCKVKEREEGREGGRKEGRKEGNNGRIGRKGKERKGAGISKAKN